MSLSDKIENVGFNKRGFKMRHKDIPMANRTIQILNTIRRRLTGIITLDEIDNYCKKIVIKIEEELKESK